MSSSGADAVPSSQSVETMLRPVRSMLASLVRSEALERGDIGFTDTYGARLKGDRKLVCELTLKDGKAVYDLNGLTRPDWDKLPRDYRQTGDAKWDAITPAPTKRQ